MQRAGGAENLHSSNPLGGSTASGITNTSSKTSLPNFSLLGQQLNGFSSNQKQQQHPQNQPHPQSQSHPPSMISGDSMNFPLGMQGHSQQFSQGHQNQQQASQAQGSVNNGGETGGFSGMQQNVSQLSVPGPGHNGSNQHFMGQLQPPQHQYQPQQSVESLMSALTTIQQKISQLQAIVPYMNQNSQMHNSNALQVQQQAAAAISQIAQVAANMFPSGSQQGSQQAPHQALHQTPHQAPRQAAHQAAHQAPNQAAHQAPNQASHQAPHQAPHQASHQAPHQASHQTPHQAPHQAPHQNQQQQQHSQQAQPQLHSHMLPSQQPQQLQSHQQDMSLTSQAFFGAGVPPGQQSFNFLQGGNGTSGNNNGNGLGNHFGNSQGIGANGGVSMDLPNTSSSLSSQMVDGGVSGNPPPANGSGMNVASKGSSGGGGPGYGAGAQNVGGSNGSNVNSAITVHSSKQNSPLRNQVGGGMSSRGGSNPDMTHINSSTRASMPTPSTARATTPMDDRDDVVGARDDDDDGDNENLAPGSYDLVELDATEILAEHTHFCDICGKGFKRDANLRMHMRGHGDEYKTPAALARPDKASHELAVVRPRRYSCPYGSCKRNRKHRKFQPLKTMLCVKNHYRRSHCPKILTCNKCKTKKFSVVADLKTHEKHCGCDKWQCSCGTTFSRKDKLIGHIQLFVGHKPAYGDMEAPGALDGGEMGQGNSSAGPNASSNGSGYGLSAAGNINPGSQPNMGCGSGMGLSDNSLQGLSSRGGTQGGNTLTMPKDGNVLVPDNSSSSDSFPSGGISNSMFPNLFNNTYLQSNSGGNASDDGLH